MKALILEQDGILHVVDVAEVEFDVADPLYWVTCPGNVISGMIYDGAAAFSAVVSQVESASDPVPPSVSRFQAQAALYQAGLLDDVEALMMNPATDPIARLAWVNAQEFKLTSPTIEAVRPALGLTVEQLYDMFRFAATIDA